MPQLQKVLKMQSDVSLLLLYHSIVGIYIYSAVYHKQTHNPATQCMEAGSSPSSLYAQCRDIELLTYVRC